MLRSRLNILLTILCLLGITGGAQAAGVVTRTVTTVTYGNYSDLTNAASGSTPLDWVRWGRNGTTGVDRRSSGGLISNYTNVGGGTVSQINDLTSPVNDSYFSWSDGTAASGGTASGGDYYALSMTSVTGRGFRITVPSTTSTRMLRLFVSTYNGAAGKLTCTLNGTTLNDTVVSAGAGLSVYGEYRIRFSDSASSTMQVDWLCNNSSGAIRLEAAVLCTFQTDISSIAATEYSFEDIQSRIISAYGCTGCHTGTGSGGLDLSVTPYSNLVNVDSAQQGTWNTTIKRVVPNDTSSSLMFYKINCPIPPIGDRMPQGGPYLSTTDQALIRDWINGGCPNVMAKYTVTGTTSMTAGSTVTYSAQLADANGTAIKKSGISVTWTESVNGSGTFKTVGTSTVTNVSTTNSNGIAQIDYTITKAGTENVVATGTSDATVSGSLSITCSAAAANKWVVTGTTPVTAGSNDTLTAQIQDQFGNNVASSGKTPTWSASRGSFSSIGSTNASGAATVTYTTSTGVNTTTVTASGGTITNGGTFDVTTQAGATSKWFVSVSSSSPVAGSAITVSAQLQDVNGNNTTTSGVTPTWGQSGAVGSFSNITATNSSGLATATFTTNTTVGSTTLTASGTYTSSNTSITSVAGTATKYIVTSNNSSPVAGAAVTITATLTDANNNTVSNSTKKVTLSSNNGGSFGAQPTTLSNGVASVSYTTNTTVGSFHITATDDTTPASLTGTSIDYTTVAGTAAKYVVTSTSNNPSAASTVTVTAQLADTNGNAVNTSGLTVNWTTTNGASPANASGSTDTNGRATLNVTVSSSVGVSHLVTASTSSPSYTGNVTLTTVLGSPTKYVVTSSTNSPVADNATGITISAQLADAGGNAVTGTRTVNWTSTPAGVGSFGSSSSTTNVSGLATVTFFPSNTSGVTYTFTATDTASPFYTGTTTATITSVPGPAHHYVVSVNTTSPIAGNTVNVSAQLQDKNNNNILDSTHTVIWTKTGSGGSFSPASSGTNSSGIASTVFTTGTVSNVTYVITATDQATSTVNGSSANVTTQPGAAAKWVVSTTTPNPVAGTSITVNAQLQDSNSNNVPSSGVTPTWGDGGVGGSFSGIGSTNASGLATATYTTITTVASATLTASTSGLANGSTTITSIHGAASYYEVTSTSYAPVAGSSVTISATLRDINGNVVNDALPTPQVTLSSDNGGSFASNPNALVNGTVSVVFTTNTTVGTTKITALDNSSIAGAASDIVTIPGAATKYIVSSSQSSVIAGTTVTLTAQLADANNNAVATANQTVAWTKNGGAGSFQASQSNTDASGKATIDFTTTVVAPATQVLTASTGAITGNTSVSTVSGTGTVYSVSTNSTNLSAGVGVVVTAQLRDSNGNPVSSSGRTVTWSTDKGGQFSSGGVSTTSASGAATIVFTPDSLAGTVQQISVVDDNATPVTGISAQLTTRAGTATQYLVSADSYSPTAGSNVTVSAQLADAFGNAVSTAGKVVNWTRTGAGGSLAATSSNTNSSGIATVTLTVSTTAGVVYDVTGTDSNSLTGTSADITTQAGTATQLILQPSSTSPIAGSTITVAAQLADAFGNSVKTGNVQITWSSSNGGTFDTPTSSTDSNGVATVQFTSAVTTGSLTISATDGTITSTSATITTKAGAAAAYVVNVSNTAPSIGGSVKVTAQLVDANSNAVNSSGHVITWTSSVTGIGAGTFASATSTTNGSGAASVSFTTNSTVIASYVITATDAQNLSGASAEFTTVASNTATAPVITSALSASGFVGVSFSYTVTATGTAPIVFTAAPLPDGLVLSGDIISGTPTAAGTTVVTLTASNTAGNDTKTLVITVADLGGGSGAVLDSSGKFSSTDTDNDGVSDLFEKLAGTSPVNPNDKPNEPLFLSADKIQAKLAFNKPNKDSLGVLVRLTVQNPNFELQGVKVTMQVGALGRSDLQLDAKGRAVVGTTTLQVKRASAGSSSLILMLAIKNDELKTNLAQSGLSDKDAIADKVTLPLAVVIKIADQDYVFDGEAGVTYKAIKGKAGFAKRSR